VQRPQPTRAGGRPRAATGRGPSAARRVVRSQERLQQPSGEANVSPPHIFPRTLPMWLFTCSHSCVLVTSLYPAAPPPFHAPQWCPFSFSSLNCPYDDMRHHHSNPLLLLSHISSLPLPSPPFLLLVFSCPTISPQVLFQFVFASFLLFFFLLISLFFLACQLWLGPPC
jgi:hypothetical protein